MASDSEARNAAKYIAWLIGGFLGAGGGTVMLAPSGDSDGPERLAVVESRINHLERDFEQYRDADKGFTADEGEIHSRRIATLEAESRECKAALARLDMIMWGRRNSSVDEN